MIVRPPSMAVALGEPDRDGSPVLIIRNPGPIRQRLERELVENGVALPLAYRSVDATTRPEDTSWFVSVLDESGRCRSGFAAHVRPLRFAPGHRVMRVKRLGATLSSDTAACALEELMRAVRQDPTILRLNVEVFTRDETKRQLLGSVLEELGLRRLDVANTYRETAVLDLAPPTEEEVFASLSRTARRQINATAKFPVELRELTDIRYEDRIEELRAESLLRASGLYRRQEWGSRLALAKARPDLSRVIGIFRRDEDAPEALLAFAWGCTQGDHVQYADGASTRQANIKMGLSYPLIWDLIRWAHHNGAAWFDLGGITRGGHGDASDPLGGISDFKRHFSRVVVHVADEWLYEPATIRARLARVAHHAIRQVKRASIRRQSVAIEAD